DNFGIAVALSADGTRALVGASNHNRQANLPGFATGSAYVFARTGTTWTQEASFIVTGIPQNHYFGGSVALSADGSRALVGELWETAGTIMAPESGSVHVFARVGATWTEEATLLADNGALDGGDLPLSSFGTSVALSADASR